MISIYKNDYYEIQKNKSNTNQIESFFIHFKSANKSLALSLIKTGILAGGTITDFYQTICFRAFSVKPFIEVSVAENKFQLAQSFFYYFSRQLEYIISHENKSFYQLNPENIIVIDGSKIGYIDSNLLEIIDMNNNVHILNPFYKNNWDSPELNEISALPAKVHYKTIYYSLALMTLTILSDTLNWDTSKLEEEKLILYLNKIKETTLFYSLERCLEKNPNKRSILYI